ncbi:hypothetical protein C8A00DRAFT_18482 [Chaetomidium leptoderma]|uniref:Uncharacterized protein n=1 Tax=Chaetomidium leptoderma TaxID=669021 RepID=A0AAN6VEB0_9PEZI|nr:hypothetical protein C8A00DRAFT_18482 [Chaetomidium leptoderma]
MASSTPTADPLFEQNQVSSSVSAEDAAAFFQEHGFFYQADTEIGKVVAELDSQGLAWNPEGLKYFMPILLRDSRLRQILEPFGNRYPSVNYSFGSNYPGHYFASTIEPNQDHRILLYMWSAGSQLEFAVGSHRPPNKGVKAANGMYEVPYKFLKNKNLNEIKVRMEGGGVAIVHPLLAFGATEGFSMAYGLEKPEQGLDTIRT